MIYLNRSCISVPKCDNLHTEAFSYVKSQQMSVIVLMNKCLSWVKGKQVTKILSNI